MAQLVFPGTLCFLVNTYIVGFEIVLSFQYVTHQTYKISKWKSFLSTKFVVPRSLKCVFLFRNTNLGRSF